MQWNPAGHLSAPLALRRQQSVSASRSPSKGLTLPKALFNNVLAKIKKEKRGSERDGEVYPLRR
jgi:hypothetical protein